MSKKKEEKPVETKEEAKEEEKREPQPFSIFAIVYQASNGNKLILECNGDPAIMLSLLEGSFDDKKRKVRMPRLPGKARSGLFSVRGQFSDIDEFSHGRIDALRPAESMLLSAGRHRIQNLS
jgi:hypothetical protein